ncbi:MAG: hypothetical protein PHT51_01095, partial [Patescibacteria group bacterium]|nr:hypothetical protein [Patescibacteria group bacterium]
AAALTSQEKADFQKFLTEKGLNQDQITKVLANHNGPKLVQYLTEHAADRGRGATLYKAILENIRTTGNVETSLAIVYKGEGVEHSFIRQIMADPEAFGYKSELGDLTKWAQSEAHRAAIDTGYVDRATGEEIRVSSDNQAAYVLHKEGGNYQVAEQYREQVTGEFKAQEAGKTQSYEYKDKGTVGHKGERVGTHFEHTRGAHISVPEEPESVPAEVAPAPIHQAAAEVFDFKNADWQGATKGQWVNIPYENDYNLRMVAVDLGDHGNFDDVPDQITVYDQDDPDHEAFSIARNPDESSTAFLARAVEGAKEAVAEKVSAFEEINVPITPEQAGNIGINIWDGINNVEKASLEMLKNNSSLSRQIGDIINHAGNKSSEVFKLFFDHKITAQTLMDHTRATALFTEVNPDSGVDCNEVISRMDLDKVSDHNAVLYGKILAHDDVEKSVRELLKIGDDKKCEINFDPDNHRIVAKLEFGREVVFSTESQKIGYSPRSIGRFLGISAPKTFEFTDAKLNGIRLAVGGAAETVAQEPVVPGTGVLETESSKATGEVPVVEIGPGGETKTVGTVNMEEHGGGRGNGDGNADDTVYVDLGEGGKVTPRK